MKIKDYNDAIEFFRTNDYQAADGAWSKFYQSEVLEPRIMDQAALADDLEPGSLKDEMLKDFDPSQETYEEYLQRKRLGERPFNMNQGGRIGFLKGKSVKEKQQAGNVAKQQVRFDRIAELFKDEDWTGLKTKTRPARIKEGTQVDTGGKLVSQDTEMLNDIIDGGTLKEKNALAKKLGITREKMIEGWEKSKAKIATEKSAKMKKIRFTPDVEFQQKLYNEISTNPATIKEMAKRLKVDEKYLVKQSSKLLKNVYTQNVAIAKGPEFDLDARGKATLKSWLPDDFKSTDKFLDNFANIDGLKKVQTENMGILIRNAYRNNPKKYTEALKILGDYNKFVNSLPKGVKIDLDHPLSKAFLKGSGVSPDKLLYVTPVDRGFNRGFKKQLGDKYTQALNMTDPILKKEAIKNVRTLADKTGVNIGDVTGKKYDYGTTHLLDKKKNFQKEFFKNLKEQNLVAENLKNLKKTKEGKKIIEDVFPTGKVEVKDQIKLLKQMGYRCKQASGGGETLECYIKDVEETKAQAKKGNVQAAVKQRNAFRQAKKIPQVAKLLRRGIQGVIGGVGTAIGGKIGLAIEGAIEGGIYDYYRKQGYSHEQALQEGFLTKAIDPENYTGLFNFADELIEKEKIGTRWDPSGKVNLAAKYADAQSKYNEALDKYFEIQNQRPGNLEQSQAQQAALAEQEKIIRALEPSVKAGTPEYEAYQTAEENQTALMDERARDYKSKNRFLGLEWDLSPEQIKQRTPSDFKEKQREKEMEEEMDEWKGGREAFTIGPDEYIDWASYGLDDEEGIKEKWRRIYEEGGMDLLDRIAVAGGVSNLAQGGIASLKRK